MPRLINQLNVSNLETVEEVARWSSVIFDQIFATANGRLQLSDNVEFITIAASFPAANTEYVFEHTLGRAPLYYLAVTNPTGGVVYAGSTAFTSTNIYLKNTVITSSMTIWVF